MWQTMYPQWTISKQLPILRKVISCHKILICLRKAIGRRFRTLPVTLVPELVEQLFGWLGTSKAHPLIKSAVFHYEFEFIHPFFDGNGRLGRLWQTALLAAWRPVFRWIRVESVIQANQVDYYRAIAESSSQGKSNRFVEFMLRATDEAIADTARNARLHAYNAERQIARLMEVVETYPLSARQLMERLHLTSRAGFAKNYLQPALAAGLIAMTEPNKPNSRNQRYFKR